MAHVGFPCPGCLDTARRKVLHAGLAHMSCLAVVLVSHHRRFGNADRAWDTDLEHSRLVDEANILDCSIRRGALLGR